jgi:hypothetical protein
MDTKLKHPPCPSCLACGDADYASTHELCSSGPPPRCGLACECPACEHKRTNTVVLAAREVLLTGNSPRALEHLQEAFTMVDLAARTHSLYWARNIGMIQEALDREAAA